MMKSPRRKTFLIMFCFCLLLLFCHTAWQHYVQKKDLQIPFYGESANDLLSPLGSKKEEMNRLKSFLSKTLFECRLKPPAPFASDFPLCLYDHRDKKSLYKVESVIIIRPKQPNRVTSQQGVTDGPKEKMPVHTFSSVNSFIATDAHRETSQSLVKVPYQALVVENAPARDVEQLMSTIPSNELWYLYLKIPGDGEVEELFYWYKVVNRIYHAHEMVLFDIKYLCKDGDSPCEWITSWLCPHRVIFPSDYDTAVRSGDEEAMQLLQFLSQPVTQTTCSLNKDLAFEEVLAGLGCHVYLFNPFLEASPKSPNIFVQHYLVGHSSSTYFV
ncbi:unnamed protein product [Darwinula stevensoni]|uniref:Glycosyltransferase family 92 protein n=1 Tax=Darwinula stevensoni TaxID=69355 RepID=A0A7R8X607_9CRUS|nr:unnamed protein product [Darwinula stevensoni]CAG0885244.1 unnamed protein product [Darwinula stevensoni]